MNHARIPPSASPFLILEEGPFLASLNSAILAATQVQSLIEDLHKLNRHEQTFICVDTFLKEAEADGVGHFFYYDCAALYDHVLLGLEEIGARETRSSLMRYVDRVFGGQVPESVGARQRALEAIDPHEAEEAERMVGGLCEATSRLVTWARGHREHFRLQ